MKTKAKVITRKEIAVNIGIKVLTVLLTLTLMIVMVFNTPIIQSRTVEGSSIIIENVSIVKYLKSIKPMEYIEGTVSKMDSADVALKDDEADDYDDGLNLHQTIEGQFTILFLGFDSKTNGSGNLHDVNYLIQFNLQTASMNILQIPRDSYMPDYTSSSTNKFNSIYSCGDSELSNIQRVVNAVQESFGIPVDAYVTTTCDNIVDIVDIIGGIPINLPYTIVYEADKVLYEGEQVLNGTQSEWFVRFRHGYTDGDIGRVQAQRIFLAAAMRKALDMGTIQVMSAMTKIYNQELIGTDLSIEEIGMLADLGSSVSMDNVNVFMVPGEAAMANGQSIWSIHKSAALDIVNEYFRTRQVPLEADQSTICEWVPEGSYLNTSYDDTAQNFQDIYEQKTSD
jgi:LCP family protein required for cell wall assembly